MQLRVRLLRKVRQTFVSLGRTAHRRRLATYGERSRTTSTLNQNYISLNSSHKTTGTNGFIVDFKSKTSFETGLHRAVDWYTEKIYSKAETKREYLSKRPFDILLSSLGLILSIPLWIIVALAIWIEDMGPVFYCSERVGKRGRVFKTFKFRTMVRDSDTLFGPLQARENDHRITHVGKFLRATAIDELPQLYNILKGDMSLVGPRALLPREIEIRENSSRKIVPLETVQGYWERHTVRPGLTGIAQVYAARDIKSRQKFRYDLLYIERQGLWLDIKLILLSFWISFRGKWESRKKKL